MMIVRDIGSSAKRFGELMDLIFANEDTVSARAAWALGHAAEAHPQLVRPHLTRMLENLRQP